MNKISIIIAVYNVEPYLRRSMDCLMNQTLEDLEFICIDDCSTDNSLTILKEYAQKDSRFKIITSEKNLGVAAARNKGLENATGEYIGFIDPDDAIDLNFYEELYKKAKEGDYDIAKCPIKIFYTNGKTATGKDNQNIRKYGIYGFFYEWTCAIYKSSVIYGNNIKFKNDLIMGEDTLFLNEVVSKSHTINLIDDVFYYYYMRKKSLNSNKLSPEKFESAVYAIKKVLDNINDSDIFQNNQDAYNYAYIRRFSTFSTLFYKCISEDYKQTCAKEIINYFYLCKDINTIEKKYKYKCQIKYIKNKDISGLKKCMSKYKNVKDLKDNIKFIEKIFSIKNDKNGYKIIRILGLKIKTCKVKQHGH